MKEQSSSSSGWGDFLRECQFLVTGHKYNEDGTTSITHSPIRTAVMSVLCLTNLFGMVHGIMFAPSIYSVVVPGAVAGWTGFRAVWEYSKSIPFKQHARRLLLGFRELDPSLSKRDIKLRNFELTSSGVMKGSLEVNFHKEVPLERVKGIFKEIGSVELPIVDASGSPLDAPAMIKTVRVGRTALYDILSRPAARVILPRELIDQMTSSKAKEHRASDSSVITSPQPHNTISLDRIKNPMRDKPEMELKDIELDDKTIGL